MTRNTFIRNKRGFALAEIAVGLLVMTILAGIVVPNYVNGLRQDATKKTALEVAQIQEAARKFYVDNNAWPASFAALTPTYLDAAWVALGGAAGTPINPFGNHYSITSNASQLSVQVDVPTDMKFILLSNLPMATNPSGLTIESDVPVPGGAASGVPPGIIVPLGTNTVPSGWLLCWGQPVSRVTYNTLFAAISTNYGAGDGSTTFNVPDLRGRTIVGLDDMGGTRANVLNSAWSRTIGGGLGIGKNAVGGEENHTLTIAEMPAHSHGYRWWNAWYFSGSTELAAKGSYNDNQQTSTVGGNAPHNNVQPSMATNWIIKT